VIHKVRIQPADLRSCGAVIFVIVW